jgi:D-glycero-D-manno-heptose 1,7-bisphosphate phosphatase
VDSASPVDKVLILDRDGTLVIDRGYLADPAGLEFVAGAAEGVHWLYSRGFRLVVISNQSGVVRGYFSHERLQAMNARLNAMVELAGARLEGIYCCPHAPDAGCPCRKPALGLMTQAASELRFNPASAVVMGDKESDIEFGRSARAATILIAAKSPQTQLRVQPDIIAPDFTAAARAAATLRA